ncbi:MAG: FAD-dependent oxidoreductase [Thermosynechococcaceae cyanobacterium]
MTQAGILDDRNFTRPSSQQSLSFPLLVVGGSTAAYSATLGALQAGMTVCLVQPHLVLGGQFTAQALPASDDGRLLTPCDRIPLEQRDPQQLVNSEEFALSRSQRQFRDRQRQLQPVAGQILQNPGGSWVSHLSVTPTVASIALNEAILPFIENGQLTVIPFADPIEVLFQAEPEEYRRVIGVRFRDSQTHHDFTVHSAITIEATDLGDLLELGEIESRLGQESRSQTREAALPETAYPFCQQAVTVCAVVERNCADPIPSPDGYDNEPWLQSKEFTCDFWSRKENQWQRQCFYDIDGMFRYRRLQRSADDEQVRTGDVTVLNWSTSPLGIADGPPDPDALLGCGNDYVPGVLVGVSLEERKRQIQRACDRTLAYIYFLQTELKDLKPRGDLTWTETGLALFPYIREARRGVALTTIRHQDVAQKFFPDAVRARTFTDSVGIGQYHYLDMHPNDALGQVDLKDGHDALPFTIPLGALIPERINGLILSSKSIGTTHITNAAYRMHPVEWAIGEAGGYLAAFALQAKSEIREVVTGHLREFQQQLAQAGIPIVWLNDVSHDDPDFPAIQILATALLSQTSATLPPVLEGRGGQRSTRQENPIGKLNTCELLGEYLIDETSLSFRPDAIATLPSLITALQNLGIPISAPGNDQHPNPSTVTLKQLIMLIQPVIPQIRDRIVAVLPSGQAALRNREIARALSEMIRCQEETSKGFGDEERKSQSPSF